MSGRVKNRVKDGGWRYAPPFGSKGSVRTEFWAKVVVGTRPSTRYISPMSTILPLLIIAGMIATLVALVRGIVIFLKTTEAELKGDAPATSAVKSNKMMQQRVIFQGVTILIVCLALLVLGTGR